MDDLLSAYGAIFCYHTNAMLTILRGAMYVAVILGILWAYSVGVESKRKKTSAGSGFDACFQKGFQQHCPFFTLSSGLAA